MRINQSLQIFKNQTNYNIIINQTVYKNHRHKRFLAKNSVKSRHSLYNVLDLPILFYVLECWIIKAKTKSRLVAAEIKFTRKSFDYNWKTNSDVLNSLKLP